MIAHLHGKLVEATPVSAVVEAGGVGYAVHCPVTTAERLPAMGEDVRLFTMAVYREDAAELYAFASRAERDFFRTLVGKVSGVGPKIALSLFSALSLPVLQQAIATGDAALLARCPGIGKKTAERLCVELRDVVAKGMAAPAKDGGSSAGGMSVEALDTAPNSPFQDAVAALMALGYKPDAADKAARKAQQALGDDVSTEAIIKAALK